MAARPDDFWCSHESDHHRPYSTTSLASQYTFGESQDTFPQDPAPWPLRQVQLQHSAKRPSPERKRFSWQTLPELIPEAGISINFAPHPGVRPFSVWVDDETEEEAAEILEKQPTNNGGEKEADVVVYPEALPLALIVLGVCLSVFIISLDRSILTTAIPAITATFDSTEDIGWYGSAYLLTASAFQPLYGRVYGSFSVKTSFLAALAVFELGSFVCGISPNSVSLIVGRAIQGLGSAGILTGSFVVVTSAVPLQKRPLYFAGVGILFGMGSLCGPLLGGVFTDMTTWRWCFYVNLPCGALTFATVLLCFHPKEVSGGVSFFRKVLRLDLIGNAIVLGGSIMLFLGLQHAEATMSWSSPSVIGLLSASLITTFAFIAWLAYKGDSALIPPRIIRQRTVASSCLLAFFIYATLLMHTYYLPIWFQAIQGTSAIHSGVNMIPYMCANALFGLFAGVFVSRTGLFAAPASLGCAIGTVGAGLLCTLQVDTRPWMWIGCEVLTSVGLGMAVQQGFTAVQAVLPLEDIPVGTAAVVACQSLGGALFVSVGNTILQNKLKSSSGTRIPAGIDISAIFHDGATVFRSHVPPAALPAVLDLYNEGLRDIFFTAVAMCGLSFLATFGMEWNRNIVVKGDKEGGVQGGQVVRRATTVKRGGGGGGGNGGEGAKV